MDASSQTDSFRQGCLRTKGLKKKSNASHLILDFLINFCVFASRMEYIWNTTIIINNTWLKCNWFRKEFMIQSEWLVMFKGAFYVNSIEILLIYFNLIFKKKFFCYSLIFLKKKTKKESKFWHKNHRCHIHWSSLHGLRRERQRIDQHLLDSTIFRKYQWIISKNMDEIGVFHGKSS